MAAGILLPLSAAALQSSCISRHHVFCLTHPLIIRIANTSLAPTSPLSSSSSASLARDRMEGAAVARRLLAAFAVALVVLGWEMGGCHGVQLVPRAPGSVEFIRTSCGATAYPQLCFSSLSAYASKIQANPVQLAETALSLALASARSASTVVARTAAGGGMKPRVAAAVRDCMELMGDSVEELQQSQAVMGHLGGQNLGLQISDMQTWVSAALTDDDTCVDGFQSVNAADDAKSMVRSHVVNVAQMTSNALALINCLVSTHSTTP